MSEEIGHLFMDWYSEFLWVIFYVSEKIGHLFIVDWQSFLCEVIDSFCVPARMKQLLMEQHSLEEIGQVFMD